MRPRVAVGVQVQTWSNRHCLYSVVTVCDRTPSHPERNLESKGWSLSQVSSTRDSLRVEIQEGPRGPVTSWSRLEVNDVPCRSPRRDDSGVWRFRGVKWKFIDKVLDEKTAIHLKTFDFGDWEGGSDPDGNRPILRNSQDGEPDPEFPGGGRRPPGPPQVSAIDPERTCGGGRVDSQRRGGPSW